jgi:serine/threonine protein phosphatase PrpC
MLCPKCHTPNRDNARFCKGCGLSFTPEMLAAASQPVEAAQTEVGQVQSTPSQDSQDQATPVSVASPQDATKTETQQAPVNGTKGDVEDDIALAPTQILTPQQMMAYHAKRWQQELEREQQQPQTSVGEWEQPDISDAPTMLFAPSNEQQDVADMPTILVPPISSDADEAAPVPPPPPPESLVPVSDAAVAAPQEELTHEESSNADTSTSTDTADAVSTGVAINTSTALTSPTDEVAGQEDAMEQVTPTSGGQPEQDQAQPPSEAQPTQTTDSGAQETSTSFPALAVGTVVAGRYEVTQAVSDAADEHIYLVTDHQGYQRCWNCGSPQNAEGDEFCIDCGAELLNASYNMHEYPAEQSKDNEAHVLQGTIINTFVDQGHTYVVEQPHAEQVVFPNGVHLLAASDSDAGNVRRSEPNEDSTLVLQLQRVHESQADPVGVFIVADGMGGHDNGQGASRMTISVISERMVRELLMPPLESEKSAQQATPLDEDGLVALLQGSVEDANTSLCQANQRDKSDMGSTITGFMIAEDHAYILNVGDSRTYMLREGKLHQLTNDHSLVGQLVAGGLIEPDDVYTHPQRSQIYRSLGDKLNVQIDIFKQQVYPGDVLLSCSDGLWEMVRNPQITELLSNAPDPQTACSQLIEAANTNGGEDNVSAVVVFVH